MNFLDYKKFDGPVPEIKSRLKMWNVIDFEIVNIDFDNNYLHQLRNEYSNGSVIFKTFKMPLGDDVLNWYVSRDRAPECYFFEKFWFCPGPKATFKSILQLNSEHDITFNNSEFKLTSPLYLDGILSNLLWSGGAYTKQNNLTGADALNITSKFRRSIFDDRFEDISLFENYYPWCSYFMDVAWDTSIVIFDKRNCFVHFLLATDSD